MNLDKYINVGDISKARLFYPDGAVEAYDNQKLAYEIWLGSRKGTRIAFRGKGDKTPVYSWDYLDKG